jgi:hypothetical protein
VAQADAAYAPRPRLGGKGALGEDRLVGAVKGSQAQMDDADFGSGCRRRRPYHRRCCIVERAAREAFHSCLALLT